MVTRVLSNECFFAVQHLKLNLLPVQILVVPLSLILFIISGEGVNPRPIPITGVQIVFAIWFGLQRSFIVKCYCEKIRAHAQH